MSVYTYTQCGEYISRNWEKGWTTHPTTLIPYLASSGISISIDRYFINCFFIIFMFIGYKSNCIFLNIKSQQQQPRSWTAKFCDINLIVNTNILYKYLNYVTNTPNKKINRRSRGRKKSWSVFIYFNFIHLLLLFF